MQDNAIVYFDIAAVVIMLISLASLFLRGLTKDAANRVYLSAMLLVAFTAIMALVGEAYDAFIGPALAETGNQSSGMARAVRTSIATIYYLMRSFMAPAYLILIATICDTTHKFTEGALFKVLMWGPMIAVALFVVTNPFHQLLFTFEGGVLQRGVGLQVLYAEAAFYTVTGIIWLVYWRKLFSVMEFLTLIMLFPVMFIVTLIQYFEHGLRLEMFVTSIVMMLISAFVIHPETRHDIQMNASSLSAYREMVERAFITDRRLCLVYIEIVNLEQMREMVGGVELQGLIREVSEKLAGTLEGDDMLYYLHNGAFCISSRNMDAEHALGVAQQMHEKGKAATRQKMSATPQLRSCVVRIPEDVDDIDTIRNFGRCFSRLVPASCVTTYEELSAKDGFDLQMALSDVISRAIQDHAFEVYYQPICCLADRGFHSAEALVRLNDPEFGWVPPSLFIPEAEQNGTIVDIGNILLEKICTFLGHVDYQATGLEYVEVNLSVDQCVRPEMARELLGLLSANVVEPSRVNVEITETSAMYSQQVIEKNVRKLAEAGVTLSLDDYGSGYSSIARLLSLPFSLVKIDKSFADNLEDEQTRKVLADTVATMKSIGKSVLVEGVETCEQVELLDAMGVDFIQGYYFAKPMPEAEFVSFLSS